VCYDADAVPPFYGPPVTTVTTESLTLTSADGALFAGFLARPEDSNGVGVLVLPDNRGLSGFYEQFATRLAEQGYTALAIDYFGRTAGLDYRDRGEDFFLMENLMAGHLSKLTRDGLFGDFAAAIDVLRNDCRTVASIGFCMGGRFAFQTAAARFGLSGVIGLYGYPGPLNGRPGPAQETAEMKAPILALWGGGDEGIPESVVASFDDALTAAGVEHEFVTYPGAPHGFFELRTSEFEDACADVWRRVLAFLSR
jgi:carboxymethylenebutenolidase